MANKLNLLKIASGMKVHIKALYPCDCRKLNVKRYNDFLSNNGYIISEDLKKAEIVIIWTCGFRNDYRENSIHVIHKILETTNAPILICGCLPEIDPDRIDHLKNNNQCIIIPWKEEDKYFSNLFTPKTQLSEIKRNYVEKKLIDDLDRYRQNKEKQPDRTFSDQFVKLFISEGCNLNCSYCSEKRTFPPYQSYPFEELIGACSNIIEKYNQYNLMLIADNVGEYGMDINSSLPELIHSLLAINDQVKIGIQNLNPAYFFKFFDDFEEFIKNDRMLHLRLPIQSASDKILKSMNRTYSKSDIERIFSFLTKVAYNDFSTDMICGFPGETIEDYEETINFILNFLPTYINLSAFMSSSTIPAGKLLNQISEEEKKKRVNNAEKIFSSKGIYCNTGSKSDKRRSFINSL